VISNYRPISLTCVPSKIMERIVANKILNHLYSNNILSNAQHGFVKRRSTCTNLLECFNDWTVCVQSRQQIGIVYIDFSKAFDVVSHTKLFARLHIFTISLQKHINVLLRSSVPSNVEILICYFVLIQFILDLWLNTILLFRPLSLLKISRPFSLFKGVSQSDYLVSVVLHTMNV